MALDERAWLLAFDPAATYPPAPSLKGRVVTLAPLAGIGTRFVRERSERLSSFPLGRGTGGRS